MSNPVNSNSTIIAPSAGVPIEFGTPKPAQGSGGATILAVIVTLLGVALWFRPSSANPLVDRFTRVGHTLGDVLLYPPDESKFIILFLLGLTTVTFVRLGRDRKRLNSEKAALQALRAKIKQSTGRVDAQELMDALRDQPTDSILVRAVQAVWQARNLQTPDLEAISASVFVLESGRSQIGRPVANRLLLLSLLGTIIGLAGVIGTLQSQIGSARGGDVDALLQNLQGTLTTMGTAFASTAYGILLSVAIAYRASEVNEGRSHYVAEVQYFAVCELAPRLLPVSLPQAIAQIEALVGQSEAFVTESRDMLNETRVQNVHHLQELDRTIRESARLTANVVAGIEEAIRDAAKEVHDALANAGQYVVDGAQAQITVARSLDTLLGQATTSMENTILDLKSGMQDLSSAVTVVQSAYRGLNTAVEGFKTSLDKQSQEVSDAVRGRLNEAATAAAAVTAAAQQQAASQQQAAAQQAAVQQASMKKLSEEITTTLTAMTTQVSDFMRRSEPKLPSEQEWSRLQKTLDRCAEASAAFATAISRLEKDGLTGGASRTNGSAGVTSTEMQTILATVSRQVTDSISAAPQPLRDDLRELRQDLRQMLQRMEQVSQQAAQRRPEQPPYRGPEQAPYRPPVAQQQGRPAEPPVYGNGFGQEEGRQEREAQRPPTPPTSPTANPPAQAPVQPKSSWWPPFGKKE